MNPTRCTLLLLFLMSCLAVPAAVRAAPAATQPAVSREQIEAIVDKAYPELETLYTTLHRSPELSLQEEHTAERLAGELRRLGYAVTEHVGRHGVVAVMENGPGKTLLIRTDLDALPVKEETGAAYASTATGTLPEGKPVDVMHACGHDVHVTSLVGTARTMVALKEHWHGTLVLIGQPAEEIGAGARMMLADGLFTRFPRPDWCLALHVGAELETGKVNFTAGPAMANADSVDITVRGVGGHGAQPHMTKDPVVVAAQIVLALQTIASRETKPGEAVVVTVGSIHGGTKHNVIPDEVKLQLTVRTFKDETRARTLKSIERIAKGTAMAAGIPPELEPIVRVSEEYTPATYNTPELVERVTGVFRGLLGPENVVEAPPTTGAEDFGRYGRAEPKIPIFMYRLGAVPPAKVAESKRTGVSLPSLHSAKFLPDHEPTIKLGVLTMTAAALDLLQ